MIGCVPVSNTMALIWIIRKKIIDNKGSSTSILNWQDVPAPTAQEQEQEVALKQKFRNLAGDDMEIDAYELQDILNAIFTRGEQVHEQRYSSSRGEFSWILQYSWDMHIKSSIVFHSYSQNQQRFDVIKIWVYCPLLILAYRKFEEIHIKWYSEF